MYTLTSFNEKHYEFVEKNMFILSLQMRWCGDFDACLNGSAVNEGGEVCGVFALSRHSSWYSDCAAENKLVFNYCFTDIGVLPTLIKGAYSALETVKAKFPEKNNTLIAFVQLDDFDETQALLNNGFFYNEIIPVLKYVIPSEISHSALPDGVTIEQVTNEQIGEYLAATALANNGVADSEAEYRFRMGDDSFLSYRAVYRGKTIGGISVWNIGEKRSATENIFTIPEFRRKGIASELISTAFEEIKRRGKAEATLSLLGSNTNAMKLYQKIGYKLAFYIAELRA